jgi:hypothetical protein
MKIYKVFPLFFCALFCQSDAFSQDYFQQEVDYKIAVKLNDEQHTISGNIAMDYTNHAPDTLPEIWVHLWGNAYKNRQTAFCKQKLRSGNSEYYFAKEHDLGEYDALFFTANGRTVDWKYDPKNPDIAVLTLPEPLAPGGRIRIETPFALKIPASFSRLGHVETSYQMTQWYPKPAVYDQQGWHAMPYLDQGEFYSEFGNFQVDITLPENYVVGATGVLNTPSEIAFLQEKEVESRAALKKGVDKKHDPFPPSAKRMKTLRYTAQRVHDFAWFADKRFFVLKDTAHLASGKSVDCWAMFTQAQSDIWQKGAAYVRRSVEFYSEKVGDYPWPQATAVHSALSAGGGMEYPMVTVIGDAGSPRTLDQVITHEVGHNWFYGILASNERLHPFMDEGFNSYYERRYMEQYYGSPEAMSLPKKLFNPKHSGSLIENGLLLLALNHQDTPPDSPSDDFTQAGYGLQVYMKTAFFMTWLEKSIGTAKMDAAMYDYYQKWQFRHPYPKDFQTVMAENAVDAGWFLDAMQTQKNADYALKKVVKTGEGKWSLTVEQQGTLDAPFPISALKDGVAVKTTWYKPRFVGRGLQQLDFEALEADAFVLDHERVTLDLNRKNNTQRVKAVFPGLEPLQLKLIAPFKDPSHNTVGITPWVGWNNTDKTMVGLVCYNPFVPPLPLQVYLLPGYALGSKKWVGLADVRYRFYPGGFFPKITAIITAKSFHLDHLPTTNQYTRFFRIAPQIRAELPTKTATFSHYLHLTTLFMGTNAPFDGANTAQKWRNNTIHEWRYEGEQRMLPNPFRFQVALETQRSGDSLNQQHYLRSTASWQQQFYFAPKRKLSVRLFAGYFIQNDFRNRDIQAPYNNLTLLPQGFNDYKYDQLFLARAGADGLLGRQVSQTDGGFKGAFGPIPAGTIGNSNNLVLSINLKTDLPFRLPLGVPLKPYFDLGYADDASKSGQNRPFDEQLLWNGGLMLEFLKGGLEVYFPLFSSASLKAEYCKQAGGTRQKGLFCGGNYLKVISWSIKINNAEPLDLIQRQLR